MKNVLILVLLLPFCVFGQSTIFKDINVIDVENRKVIKETSVVITDGKISQISKFKKIIISENDSVIEAKDKYLSPGLIDSHIHFFQSGGLYTRPDAVDLRKQFSYPDEIQFAKNNVSDYLSRYLRIGITTVMDVGGPFWNFVVRDSIAQNMIAPNVLVTGPLFSIVDRPKLDEGDPPIIKVSSEKDIDVLFNKMLPYKPDFIKIWYIASKQNPAKKSYPLIKYLGDLCKANNLMLAVHATELETAKLAVKAGANILVHSIDDKRIPKAFVKELKSQNITYIPTLTVTNGYFRTFTGNIGHKLQDLNWANPFAYKTLMDLKKIDATQWPPFLKKIHKSNPSSFVTLKDSLKSMNLNQLTKAGINIATGTDAGNIGTMHASSYQQELLAMKKANLSNWDLLVSSTLNPAIGFGISDKYGSIKVGKQADLIMLEQNPLDDIHNLGSIELVVKSGKVLYIDSILRETPEQIVQKQVNAYNARNIEVFLSTYSEDIEIFDEQDKLIMKGHDEMRASYSKIFDNVEDLYCEIENRIVINNKVIDKEKVRFNNKYINAVVVYHVLKDKIVKVNFLK